MQLLNIEGVFFFKLCEGLNFFKNGKFYYLKIYFYKKKIFANFWLSLEIDYLIFLLYLYLKKKVNCYLDKYVIFDYFEVVWFFY